MKRLALIAVLFSLGPVLRAAEPATPELTTSTTPEVTDPDLKEATPVMRQGTDEPLGGFKDTGLKGKSAIGLGWDGAGVLGASYWLSDCVGLKAAIGGSYKEPASAAATFVSELQERLALRVRTMDLGAAGFVFLQPSVGAKQSHDHSESRVDNGSYLTVSTDDIFSSQVSAGLDVGAELFWPGSRRASLELSSGLGALWTFGEHRNKVEFQPDTAAPATSYDSSSRAFELGTRFSPITAAVNIYFN